MIESAGTTFSCKPAAIFEQGEYVKRLLQRGGNPTQLGSSTTHIGRIFKTLHVLSYVD
jgi:hypothetical protein